MTSQPTVPACVWATMNPQGTSIFPNDWYVNSIPPDTKVRTKNTRLVLTNNRLTNGIGQLSPPPPPLTRKRMGLGFIKPPIHPQSQNGTLRSENPL